MYFGGMIPGILTLISAGEGPKASLEEIVWNEISTKQKTEFWTAIIKRKSEMQ
jgi:hypothetical protein